MPPLCDDVGKFQTVQSMVEHAIGCLLVAELSFFLMEHKDHVWKEVLSLAVKEYKTSNMHVSVSKDVKAILHDYSGDMDGLCDSIIKVIVENRMTNKFLMESGAK
ncbi:hypothetical protein EDD16DRAFT_1708297 [Pisolithus croceorrhizus]|nr:hypothetical protein EDD16DRAFT_1708297 [Pisolithus croceorrhizus]KAI6117311.1 hypothetical protein EV401DRAFT_2072657 [Pisolithus croceorrhizus]KAI6140911.1 hypothetical protein EDD17DRAFT_1769926 [Pisolithus thermaeus]